MWWHFLPSAQVWVFHDQLDGTASGSWFHGFHCGMEIYHSPCWLIILCSYKGLGGIIKVQIRLEV